MPSLFCITDPAQNRNPFFLLGKDGELIWNLYQVFSHISLYLYVIVHNICNPSLCVHTLRIQVLYCTSSSQKRKIWFIYESAICNLWYMKYVSICFRSQNAGKHKNIFWVVLCSKCQWCFRKVPEFSSDVYYNINCWLLFVDKLI